MCEILNENKEVLTYPTDDSPSNSPSLVQQYASCPSLHRFHSPSCLLEACEAIADTHHHKQRKMYNFHFPEPFEKIAYARDTSWLAHVVERRTALREVKENAVTSTNG